MPSLILIMLLIVIVALLFAGRLAENLCSRLRDRAALPGAGRNVPSGHAHEGPATPAHALKGRA